jgi:cytoskeletal protein CcmA (bactofilin family)
MGIFSHIYLAIPKIVLAFNLGMPNNESIAPNTARHTAWHAATDWDREIGMANQKYELLQDDTKEFLGRKLYRIRALVAIGLSVAAGDVGGYVESEKNLQVSGDAWVYGNARVSGDAQVSGNAQVYGDARVSGDAQVSGDARVSGDAQVQKPADIQTYSGVGSSYGTLTVYRTKDGIELTRGCFQGDLDKFRAAVHETHGASSKIGRSYLGIANLIEFWFDIQSAEIKEAA